MMMSNLELLGQIVLTAQPDDDTIDTSRECGVIVDFLEHLYANSAPNDPHLLAFVELVENAYATSPFEDKN
jgi:hypothetical protein